MKGCLGRGVCVFGEGSGCVCVWLGGGFFLQVLHDQLNETK